MPKKVEKDEKELDLLDPSTPLLVEFKEKCPGTFKHSQTLADIVESCAQVLELDGNKLKLAAMYHDIGKMVNPDFFSENQGENNPHDDLEPLVSVQYITRHVSDSVLILINEPEFPRDVIEIISQHHGNTVVLPFWQKTPNKPDTPFRYPGKHPQTVEASVLMLCDMTEATAASHFQSHKDIIPDDLVEQVCKKLTSDHQLDEMKIGNLQTIKEVLVKELRSLYPKRIDYENGEKKKKNVAGRKHEPY